MMNEIKLTKYERNNNYSYTFGIFPTFELVKNCPNKAVEVVFSTKLKISADIQKLLDICKEKNIKIEYNDKVINRLVSKENCFVVGVFEKYNTQLVSDKNNLVLVNPSDMGNMGTGKIILRDRYDLRGQQK